MKLRWYLLGSASLIIAAVPLLIAHRPETAPVTPPSATDSPSRSLPPTIRGSGQIETPAASSAPATTPKSAPSTGNFAHAPRQAELARFIHQEFPYRALLIPNDPYAQNSWALSATRAYDTWDRTTGGSGTPIIVANIDTGFALDHEDLASQWYQNPGEQGMTAASDRCWSGAPTDKRSNSCDDDSNGYVDDWRGWNFAGTAAGSYQDPNNNPQAGVSAPNGPAVSHGTQTAGLLGAASNNGKGIATLNWNVRVMPLQTLDDNGSGWTSDIVAAIHYAVDNGASVINMSLGGDHYDADLDAAIQYAYAHNVVVVAAAGNCGTGNESGCDPARPGAMGYPALNRHVIAVGASNADGSRASFSSYGPGLDVLAPGSGAITAPRWSSTNPTSAYSGALYGTSFASPLVASYASLLRAQLPNASVDVITSLVDGTARKVAAMNSTIYTDEHGHGLIDTLSSSIVASAPVAPQAPTLLQTGSHSSEHSFRPDTMLHSGCVTSAGSACTIWAQDIRGYDRYLSYYIADSNGRVGWQWPGSSLMTGEWFVRAISTQPSATPYYLFSK